MKKFRQKLLEIDVYTLQDFGKWLKENETNKFYGYDVEEYEKDSYRLTHKCEFTDVVISTHYHSEYTLLTVDDNQPSWSKLSVWYKEELDKFYEEIK